MYFVPWYYTMHGYSANRSLQYNNCLCSLQCFLLLIEFTLDICSRSAKEDGSKESRTESNMEPGWS